ncbi:SURF1-like protein [Kocuria dechangensis]|uniref:SURF1-like protein n=1 Tax=Kocuria dechangensis TaxID=1176249 RepID=A0A917GM82_9MICC|nr:SURF1 family protein [Kocuria dechangensis]GGG51054.1 SURF1-like protein [Kocuria dechangensis]
MLKTALRPRSLLALALSLGIAVAFVLLSQWQLESSEQSRTVADPAKDVARPLTEADRAGTAVTVPEADQLVTATGVYRDGSTVLVPGRLQDGAEGWWVVSALTLPGTEEQWPAADGPLTVAVARGWVADPALAPDEPAGTVGVVGRYLPPEAPLPGEDLPDGQVPTVSPAQLTNLWDAPLYAGFVAAFAESPAGQPLQVGDDGALAADPSLLSPELSRLEIDQQPTDESVNLLNLFYAVEWVVFAGFAVYIWWRFVRDQWLREQNPEEYFYLDGDHDGDHDGEYYWDESAGRYYYYDPAAGEYYWFDDQPADQPVPQDQPADRTENRTGAHHD